MSWTKTLPPYLAIDITYDELGTITNDELTLTFGERVWDEDSESSPNWSKESPRSAAWD